MNVSSYSSARCVSTAAARGFVDDVIEARKTRPYLIKTLELIRTKREARPARKHGNVPL